MLSSIIKVKLEKNCCSFEELEKFFADNTFHINDRKGFKDSSVELVIKHSKYPILILTLPREGIPNSFALKILSSLYRKNELASPVILKYLIHRNLSKDFDNISRKLQAKVDQDIQAQNDSKISKEIELCKEDISNVLSGGKSVLDDQLKQRYKAYYSLIDSEIEELKAKISRESEDYVNNTNIHKMYQSLNSKIKKIDKIKQNYHDCPDTMVVISLYISGAAALLMLLLAPLIALPVHTPEFLRTKYGGIGYLDALMYTASPFLVVAALALTVAGIAYLTSCYLKYSFTKEMQDYINEEPKCIDKATNTEDVKELEQKETVVGDLSCDCDKMEDEVQPSAPPLSEMKLKTGELYPWSDLSKSDQQISF